MRRAFGIILAPLVLPSLLAMAQPVFRITVGETETRTATFGPDEFGHVYLVDVPLGASAFLVSADANRANIDLEVRGPSGAIVYANLDDTTFPGMYLTSPHPGTYEILVGSAPGGGMVYKLTTRVGFARLNTEMRPWESYERWGVTSQRLGREEMRAAIDRGEVQSTDVVWRSGLGMDGAWVLAGWLPEFADLFLGLDAFLPDPSDSVLDADGSADPSEASVVPDPVTVVTTDDTGAIVVQVPAPTVVSTAPPTPMTWLEGTISAPGCAYDRHGNGWIECVANQGDPPQLVDVFWTVNGQVVANYVTNGPSLVFSQRPSEIGAHVIGIHARYPDGTWIEGSTSLFVASLRSAEAADAAEECVGVGLLGECIVEEVVVWPVSEDASESQDP